MKRTKFVLDAEVERQVQACSTRIAELPFGDRIAIQGRWGGDSFGWYIDMESVTAGSHCSAGTRSPFDSESLTFIRYGGDNIPMGKALVAQRVGSRLSEKYCLPFYCPSPNNEPFDERWLEFHQKPFSQIQGTLEYPDGSPACGIIVELYEKEKVDQESGKVASLTTDQTRAFKFPTVCAGNYTVVAGIPYRYLADQILVDVSVPKFPSPSSKSEPTLRIRFKAFPTVRELSIVKRESHFPLRTR